MLLKYLSSSQIKQFVSIIPHRTFHSTCSCINSYSNRNIRDKLVKYNLSFKHNLNNFKCFSYFSNHKSFIQSVNSYKNHRLLFTSKEYLENKTVNNVDPAIEKELQKLSLRFPQPKNALHNFYNNVSFELKSPEYKVTPQFKQSTQRKLPKPWTCTYNIKWPEALKIQSTAATKQDASNKAAIQVLLYLQKSGKILDNGQPVLYDRETAKDITRKTHFNLILEPSVESKLHTICDIFKTNLLPQIEKYQQDIENDPIIENKLESIEKDILKEWGTQRRDVNRHRLDIYRAKESIKLPIQDHRKEFEKLLNNNRVVIVRGEPGCGKSTRIPQYILEQYVMNTDGEPAKIIVTQPRRIAAISLAERVAQERQEQVGRIVGYQVRLKSRFNPQTGRILYCTTGILLRQLQSDASLTDCTHVILDEAHERDVNTDLLMNLLRHALDLNPNLKLVVMSATIDVGLFQKYFENSQLINIPGFTYPVKVNFLEDIKNINLTRTEDMCKNNSPSVIFEDVAKLIKWISKTKPEGAILCFLPGWDEISKIRHILSETLDQNTNLVLALHSKLSDRDQRKIFSRPPPGVRKIILATNIAETSVTVDDVVYVVDTGIHKEARFDVERGIMCMDNHWVSQSSMNQRKGRAGRVQPGESFHLYSKQKYDSLLQHSIPEILRVSLTKTVLDAKVYSHNMDAIQFFSRLPCPPENSVIVKAVQELQNLELLDQNENLTSLGKVVSEFQLAPKLSRAMVMSMIYKCVTPIVDIATIFSSESEMFSTALLDKPGIKQTKQRLSKDSDHIALLILFERWAKMMNNEDFHEAAAYCTENNVVPQKLNTLKKLQDIHYDYLEKYLKNVIGISDDYSDNEEFIKGVLLSGVGTVLMHRKWDMVKGRLKKSSVFITSGGQKATITPESVNCKKEQYKSPFLLYINETRSVIRRTTLIRETSLIHPLTLLLFKNCELSFQQVRDKSEDGIKDAVLIELIGTKLKFICSKKQAKVLHQCKSALKEMELYFIHQLTEGGVENEDILKNWEQILSILSDTLRPRDL